MPEMTGKEYLLGYLALMEKGYTSEEAKQILEDIKEEMRQATE